MRRTIASMIIAGMVVNAVPTIIPMTSAFAAAQQTTKLSTQSVLVDGITEKLTTLDVKGIKLYSAKEVAKHLKAKYQYDGKSKVYSIATNNNKVTFKGNTDYITSNNKKVKLSAPITNANGQMFIELAPIVLALGGDIIQNGTNVFIASEGLAAGSFTNAKWVSETQILMSGENEKSYLLNSVTKKVENEFPIVEMVASPDGQKAIYTTENGAVYLLDLKTGKASQISADESFKAEFKWVADGTKVYFFQGDKNEVIASMSVTDGKITKVLDDKVEYKSDLVLSADGSKLIYTAAKQAETKYTDEGKSDVAAIITEGTEPQLYLLDTKLDNSKPVAITTSKENKFFTSILPNGEVLFLAEDAENEDKLPQLRVTDGKKETTLVSTKQIGTVIVTAKGNVYVAITEENGSSSIYKYVSNKLGLVVNTTDEITSFDVSADEKQLVVNVTTEKGDKVMAYKDGHLEPLTKN